MILLAFRKVVKYPYINTMFSSHDTLTCSCYFINIDLICISDPNIGHLVGDRGYSLRPTLQIPYPNPSTLKEEAYNEAQKACHTKIEHVNGVVKKQFPCLATCLYMTPGRAPKSKTIMT